MNRAAGTWQWDDVRYFLAVARAGSLSGAARVLGVGHVTVGRRITFLEKRLGVSLLHRTPDGFAVTAAGDAVLRQCTAMENAALDLERVAAGRDSLAAGSIRLTATEALAHRVIASAIAELRKKPSRSPRRLGRRRPLAGHRPPRSRSCGQSGASKRFRASLSQAWRGRLLALCIVRLPCRAPDSATRQGTGGPPSHNLHRRP